jgi:hypothetical protein
MVEPRRQLLNNDGVEPSFSMDLIDKEEPIM